MLVNLAAARGPDLTLGGPSWAAAHALVNAAVTDALSNFSYAYDIYVY